MVNMFLAGFCFGWALHCFLEKQWMWGGMDVGLGVLNLIVAFI